MLCIALAAFALQRGATLPWASADLPDGSRYTLTPVGLTHVGAGDSGDILRDCRWWPRYGDADLCAMAPGGDAAYGRLRATYTLVSVAMWVAVIALFVQVLAIPRSAAVRAAVTWAVPALSLAAIVTFMTGAQPGLAVLQTLSLGVGGLGFGLVVAATVLSAASAWLHLAHARRSGGALG